MVVTSLIKNILPIAVVGLGLAFLYNVVAKPGEASKSAEALSAYNNFEVPILLGCRFCRIIGSFIQFENFSVWRECTSIVNK